ncbi:MAG: MATE family efflux transporter [Thermoclostridium sp.]|nr:MATE family efflux transporter [Thermoclostridium sp.]
MKKNSSHEIDMCSGPLFMKIVVFSLPLMLSGLLQLLYNAADIIVVGRFAGPTALAAVGSTGSLTNLIVSVFMGLSVGSSVAVAQYYGAGDYHHVSEVVHTSIATSLVASVIVSIFGITMAEKLLAAMGTPPDVLSQAALYLRIYFAGMPASMLFNYGSSILRAVGDTKRPLIYLTISGVLNVVLNLVFVIFFHMGVAGVALATIISQALSAVLVVICLVQFNGSVKLNIRSIRFHKDKLLQLIRIGLPAGLQGSIFSLSNVLIQSSVNSFGSSVMAGNSAAQNIEGFIYVAMNTIYHTALTFTGQNVGAREYKRVRRVFWICSMLVTGIGLVMGFSALLGGQFLLGIYAPGNAEVIGYGLIRMSIICSTYFLCGLMDTFVGMLRGMGASLTPMLVSIIGVCGFRIAWVYTVFAQHRTLETLYYSYPVSWIVTAFIHLICYFIIIRRLELGKGRNLAGWKAKEKPA